MVYGMVYDMDMIEKQFENEYYTAKELQYSNKAGTFLSPLEYKQFLEYKELNASENNPCVTLIPLKSFNSKCLYYSQGVDLISVLNIYMNIVRFDSSFIDRYSSNFIESRIYSEIEGTLNVENVPTTRKRLKELLEDNAPALNKNDIIIKNMKAGIDFINTLPEFNKDNLLKLYNILSNNCLDEEDGLKENDYYRYDEVTVDKYDGCPKNKIGECMDSLFNFVNSVLNNPKSANIIVTLLPHICHYYMIYIHPYFDYNGRTARMVSYWVYLLSGLNAFPPIISEAINQTKAKYYHSIELTRDSHNDLTYFLKYLLNISIDYVLCYQNLEEIEKSLKKKGLVLTDTELNYVKRILISYDGYFNYSDFLKFANVEMSKQGALKQLNKFVNYGILIEVDNASKTKLFDVNKDVVLYSLKMLRK